MGSGRGACRGRRLHRPSASTPPVRVYTAPQRLHHPSTSTQPSRVYTAQPRLHRPAARGGRGCPQLAAAGTLRNVTIFYPHFFSPKTQNQLLSCNIIMTIKKKKNPQVLWEQKPGSGPRAQRPGSPRPQLQTQETSHRLLGTPAPRSGQDPAPVMSFTRKLTWEKAPWQTCAPGLG